MLFIIARVVLFADVYKRQIFLFVIILIITAFMMKLMNHAKKNT